jgi:hypothetical protein
LPQLRGQLGDAKSYAERLFEFTEIGPLTKAQSIDALVKPLIEHQVKFNSDALDFVYKKTQGYPYFIQEWGKHSWDVAESSPITLQDVKKASREVEAALDVGFFMVRFDRLSPTEKKYLRAMAELGEDSHRSGDIAELMNKTVNQLAPVRAQLILKGMIWSPNHGDTAFTVPLFGGFMKSIMPGDDWKK